MFGCIYFFISMFVDFANNYESIIKVLSLSYRGRYEYGIKADPEMVP